MYANAANNQLALVSFVYISIISIILIDQQLNQKSLRLYLSLR